MHEWGIVQALLDRVEAEARAHPGSVVRRLHVRVGELCGVDRGLLATAYETFRPGTCCAEAELTLREEPVAWGCPRCGGAIPRGAWLRCAGCGVPARPSAGEDLLLDRIELEVGDV